MHFINYQLIINFDKIIINDQIYQFIKIINLAIYQYANYQFKSELDQLICIISCYSSCMVKKMYVVSLFVEEGLD